MHNSIVETVWGSQASFSERMTVQVGHISFAEREFPSKVENARKYPAFAVLKILLTFVGARNTWSKSIPLQEVVSRILAGTKAGRGKNKNKTQQKRFKDDLDPTMRNDG